MPYVEQSIGFPWDMHDYFANAMRPYTVNGADYYLDLRTEPHDAFLSRMSIDGCVPYEDDMDALASSPDFSVVIGLHDYSFGLSYGWPESTFHHHCEWTIGGWRQDLTESSWLYDYEYGSYPGPHCERQLTSVEEVRRDTEKELTQLFARLERYKQTGRYQLQWPEAASLMGNVYRQWKEATELRASFWDESCEYKDEWPPAANRGGTVGFQAGGTGWKETPLRFEMSRGISAGWQLNIFAPYSSPGDCPWYEGIVFRSEHSDAEAMQIQCPLPHSTPHRMRPTVRNPWDLWLYLSRECLPKIAEDARWRWSPPSFGW